MKKRYIFIVLVVFGVLFWALAKSIPKNPPVISPGAGDMTPEVLPAQKDDLIIVSSPLPESTVGASPVVVKGRARGNWFFEASAPVNIVNWDGLIIGEGYMTVDDGYDWMTTEYVPFTGTISYDATQLGPYKYGWIILKKDNPSGEPQFDNALEFKIFFP
ncbi:MAG: hypothetical protein QG674_349 [Patescibacteria group bacterium]|nr:hypothetical protein [Patescibacteria group bacterium]